MLAGILEVDAKGALFVRYETRLTSAPIARSIWYAVTASQGNAYSAARPGAGDSAVFVSGACVWSTASSDGRSTGCVNAKNEADRVVDVEIPAPKVRAGVQVRWSEIDQRWEKLGAHGWITAERAVR